MWDWRFWNGIKRETYWLVRLVPDAKGGHRASYHSRRCSVVTPQMQREKVLFTAGLVILVFIAAGIALIGEGVAVPMRSPHLRVSPCKGMLKA